MSVSLHLLRSEHQKRVDQFMRLAKQNVPEMPTEPSEKERILRAKLILEEVLETIRDGLGVDIAVKESYGQPLSITDSRHGNDEFEFSIARPFNMVEVVDGCCDIAVVTTGTLTACGIPDEPFQKAVDENNLAKFAEGHSWREDGKLQKPPGHQPPDIAGLLKELEG